MGDKLKISYVTKFDSGDVHPFSGLIYNIAKALEKQDIDVEYIDKLKHRDKFVPLCMAAWHKYIGKGWHWYGHEPAVAKANGKEITRRISADSDAVLFMEIPNAAWTRTDKIKAFYTDYTYKSTSGYDSLKRLCKRTVRHLTGNEAAAYKNCDLLLFCSEFTAKSAIEDYGADPSKVRVVPFGANMPSGLSKREVTEIIRSRSLQCCNLLFLGVAWERKGGPLALEITERLARMGIPVRLDIVGINHPIDNLPKYATNHGFISKSTPEGLARIASFFSEAHFLLLPTQGESFGIVFSEASSYGLPSVATKTGGVQSAVRTGLNGITFDLDAPVQEYADYIANLWHDREAYEKLALSSFNEYETRLNWDVAGRTIVEYINQVKEKRKQ